MSWTDPAGHVYATAEVLSASTLNTYVRLNLTDLDRRTTVTSASVATDETTTSTSYTDVTTPGPAVTVTIGSTGLAMVDFASTIYNSNAGSYSLCAVAVSGATTHAAADTEGMAYAVVAGARFGRPLYMSGLNAGSNTFTMKYRATANTAHFADRMLIVTPLGS